MEVIRESIFSTNGILGNFIRSVSKFLGSAVFVNTVRSLTKSFLLFVGTASSAIQFVMNLISNFSWLGYVIGPLIVSMKVYNITNSSTQGILKLLIGSVSL